MKEVYPGSTHDKLMESQTHHKTMEFLGSDGTKSGINKSITSVVPLSGSDESIRPDLYTPPQPNSPSPAPPPPPGPPPLAPRLVQLSAPAQLLAGGVAGAVSKTCTAPLARLTILFQIQGMDTTRTLQRPSIIREASRILREEGFGAFWKGNAVTIVHRLPYSALNFFAYEEYKEFLVNLVGSERATSSVTAGMGIKLLAGGCAGITSASATYPLDLVRTRLAAQTKSKYYKGIYGTLATITKDEGVLGLYKGLGATLLGVGPAIAINFCAYETLKAKWISSHPETPGPLVSLGCGSLAGICSSTATFPIDLVRRRMQLHGAGGRTSATKLSVIQMFSQIIRREGIFALYRGIIPEYYKVVPGVSIAFMTYEFMRRILGEEPQ